MQKILFCGAALKLESSTQVEATANVFACNDYYGVDNAKRSKDVILNENLFAGNLVADYLEFNMKMDVDDMEDEADLLDEAEDCVAGDIKLRVSKEWAAKYMARNVIDRNAAEADVKVLKTRENMWRSILGLNLKGSDLNVDSDVWLPRLSLEDGLKCGETKYQEKFGCSKPAPGGMPE